ncbi:FAD-binding oxidoreductase [Marinitoga lauensis]|uniref:iron-sulfur cluster-binding protein n=1 Tax=Marinitoga lauensis TaxID=2201189 RepID=UPI001012BD45|nr:FAD-binding oxidoreductase [Marinitoga lauensis]
MVNTIVQDIKTTENYILLTIKTEKEINIEPGQFVMLKLKQFDFGKPFSVIYQEGKIIKFLIAVVGKMTKEMKNLKIGDSLELRGPYGIPFIEKLHKNKKYVLLGGDCGSAPLIHFSEKYPELVREQIYGFVIPEIKKILNIKHLHIDIEEGINPLQKAENLNISNDDGFLVCGSLNFIKYTQKKFMDYKIFASLEARMGCGIGMCKGCPIKTNDGIKMICKDGPIFDLSEVDLEW